MVDGIKGSKSPFLLRPGAGEAGNLPGAIDRLRGTRPAAATPAAGPDIGRPEAASLPAFERAAPQASLAVAKAAPIARALGRELAAAPPVNSTKVTEVRQAIEAGTLRPDADRIASAMIAQEVSFLNSRS
ncbi:MAG: flagellar biosynthesis anti-sigma factor FlgM [Sphingomonadaceae bacterium]